MPTVTVHEAKTTLSELLRRVEAGEEIVIARGDSPVAVLRAYDRAGIAERRKAAFGCLSGRFPSPPDEAFFEAMTGDEMAGAFGPEFADLHKPVRRRRK